MSLLSKIIQIADLLNDDSYFKCFYLVAENGKQTICLRFSFSNFTNPKLCVIQKLYDPNHEVCDPLQPHLKIVLHGDVPPSPPNSYSTEVLQFTTVWSSTVYTPYPYKETKGSFLISASASAEGQKMFAGQHHQTLKAASSVEKITDWQERQIRKDRGTRNQSTQGYHYWLSLFQNNLIASARSDKK